MRKVFYRLIVLVILISLISGYLFYHVVYSPNTTIQEPYELYIPHNSGFNHVKQVLDKDGVLKNSRSFRWLSQLMNYRKESVPSGKYIIQPNSSNRQIINLLRSRSQSPIALTLSTARTLSDLAMIISKKIEADSASIMQVMKDTAFIRNLGFDSETLLCQFIPNTYEIYWDIPPRKLLVRLNKEYNKFWSINDRQKKRMKIGLSEKEVCVLASIVEKETNAEEERKIIAGVYLNRLNQNIPLQADPTVIYAIGDFTIRRVLYKHLEYDSPYNTYKYQGLPPGPICMPMISSIDAVLNAEPHDYLFFCAKPGYQGEHLFAKSNYQHNKNATIYRQWLNKEGIK